MKHLGAQMGFEAGAVHLLYDDDHIDVLSNILFYSLVSVTSYLFYSPLMFIRNST